MKMLRCLLAMSLISGLSGIAKADSFPANDFQMVVIDPTVPSNLINHIFTDNFTFTFPSSGPQKGCKSSQLFGLSTTTYLGCFTGENDTGHPLTSLQLLIPVFNFNNQLDQPGCSPVPQDIFATISCGFTTDHKNYFLSFSGGKIPTSHGGCDRNSDSEDEGGDLCSSPSIFTIAEAGIPPGQFPAVQVVANAPEPNSLLLLSTGVLSTGCFLANWRRRTFSPASSQSTHD